VPSLWRKGLRSLEVSGMNSLKQLDPNAGAAAFSICESLLIALTDLKIIDHREARALLQDAATTHRRAMPGSGNPDEHRAIAEIIERMITAGSWARIV
jgi:hypothetical protein